MRGIERASSTKLEQAQEDTRQLLVIGGRRVGKQQLLDLQRDAARYRWLRDQAGGMFCIAAPMAASLDETGRLTAYLDGEDLDAAVDTAMTLPTARRTPKAKREGANR